jgi:hypothetical protein
MIQYFVGMMGQGVRDQANFGHDPILGLAIMGH